MARTPTIMRVRAHALKARRIGSLVNQPRGPRDSSRMFCSWHGLVLEVLGPGEREAPPPAGFHVRWLREQMKFMDTALEAAGRGGAVSADQGFVVIAGMAGQFHQVALDAR